MKPGKSGVARVVDATFYTLRGLRAAWQHEAAFRQEAVLASVMVPLAFWVGRSALECAVLIGAVALVLAVELLNSGLEAAIDRIGHEHHVLSGQAKDMGSAAVFISLVGAGTVWLLIGGARLL